MIFSIPDARGNLREVSVSEYVSWLDGRRRAEPAARATTASNAPSPNRHKRRAAKAKAKHAGPVVDVAAFDAISDRLVALERSAGKKKHRHEDRDEDEDEEETVAGEGDEHPSDHDSPADDEDDEDEHEDEDDEEKRQRKSMIAAARFGVDPAAWARGRALARVSRDERQRTAPRSERAAMLAAVKVGMSPLERRLFRKARAGAR